MHDQAPPFDFDEMERLRKRIQCLEASHREVSLVAAEALAGQRRAESAIMQSLEGLANLPAGATRKALSNVVATLERGLTDEPTGPLH